MRIARGAAFVACLLAFVSAAAAERPAPCFGKGEPVTVTAAGGPAILRLASGTLVRLADLRIVDEAAAAGRLRRIAGGSTGFLRPVRGVAKDRYGRTQGDVVLRATGESLSGALLRDGLAFVDPAVMPEGCHGALFEAERRAEANGRGVWADPPVIDAGAIPLQDHLGRYVIVSGTVVDVGESRRTVFINFGEDYRTDFTALIRKADADGWKDELEALAGRRLRVRGVLEEWNGGLIRVEHPSQIERR